MIFKTALAIIALTFFNEGKANYIKDTQSYDTHGIQESSGRFYPQKNNGYGQNFKSGDFSKEINGYGSYRAEGLGSYDQRAQKKYSGYINQKDASYGNRNFDYNPGGNPIPYSNVRYQNNDGQKGFQRGNRDFGERSSQYIPIPKTYSNEYQYPKIVPYDNNQIIRSNFQPDNHNNIVVETDFKSRNYPASQINKNLFIKGNSYQPQTHSYGYNKDKSGNKNSFEGVTITNGQQVSRGYSDKKRDIVTNGDQHFEDKYRNYEDEDRVKKPQIRLEDNYQNGGSHSYRYAQENGHQRSRQAEADTIFYPQNKETRYKYGQQNYKYKY